MNDKVFLHYSQAELDRNYDQRAWITNAEEMIARYVARSEATRRALAHKRGVAYGSGPDEVLDIFPAGHAGAPTVVFIHGGAWRNFTKDDFSFVAEALVPAGVNVVVFNLSKLPGRSLPEVVTQARSALAWVWQHARDFGLDPDKLYLSGHSSGAHLAAMVMLTDWSRFGLPRDVIKGAAFVSGSYDLRPLLLSARGSYVKVSDAEEQEFSPARHADRVPCPVLLFYAENDTDEFKRHTREFAAAVKKAGRLSDLVLVSGKNHFEIIELVAEPASDLHRAMLGHIAETTGACKG
jgi:arylformamidase